MVVIKLFISWVSIVCVLFSFIGNSKQEMWNDGQFHKVVFWPPVWINILVIVIINLLIWG